MHRQLYNTTDWADEFCNSIQSIIYTTASQGIETHYYRWVHSTIISLWIFIWQIRSVDEDIHLLNVSRLLVWVYWTKEDWRRKPEKCVCWERVRPDVWEIMKSWWLLNALHEHHSPHHKTIMNSILETIYLCVN